MVFLKVGPQLTYALREALFALSHIEDELIAADCRANLPMFVKRLCWQSPSIGRNIILSDAKLGKFYRRYSYSDRIRYYWNQPEATNAVNQLISNLEEVEMPLPLLCQYMPVQYAAIRDGELASSKPRDLIRHHIMEVTTCYASCMYVMLEKGTLLIKSVRGKV